MAEEEKSKDLTVGGAGASTGEFSGESAGDSPRKAGKRKTAARKRKTAGGKVRSEYVSDSVKEVKSEKNVSMDILLVLFLALSLVLNLYFFYQNGVLQGEIDDLKGGVTGVTTTLPEESAPSGEQVKVEFYVMSQCPYGVQVENAIKPVLDKLGNYVDFSLDYIVSDNGDGTFNSLHGQKEVDGDMIQLCAAKHYPSKYMDVVLCMNQNTGGIPDNWEECAQTIGLDANKLKTCFEGSEGKTLLSTSAEAATSRNARGSPTIYIGGESYVGGRKSNDFLRAICAKFDVKPKACSDIPPAVSILALTVSDKRCDDCDKSVQMLTSQLKNMFPGAVFKSFDYSSAQGKNLYDGLNLTYLPAILFNESVKNGESYSAISRYLTPAGEYYLLAIGASFDPTKEVCNNGIDDTGNGLVDCADPDCKEALECRPVVAKKLDVFVMSMCPYGVKALDAMKEVLENFKGNINFSIGFIASYDDSVDAFYSLHGQPEVEEDFRQVCVMKYYPNDYKFMEYIWCRNKNMQGSWEDCARNAGMDVNKIKTCSEGAEGRQLLIDNIKLAEALQIGASPTWMANNQKLFNGIDAETVKQGYCSANTGLSGCSNTLSGTASAGSGSAGGSGSCG